MNEQELIELLADKEHAGWSHWMDYLFSKCEPLPDGSLVIPYPLVERWQKQVDTPYAHLSEREKQSDRNQVAHILPFIRTFAQTISEDKEHLIREVLAWNLDWNQFDSETGKEDIVAWVLDRHKSLARMSEETLRGLQYENSLADITYEESEVSHAQE